MLAPDDLYVPEAGIHDDAIDAEGEPRPEARAALEAVMRHDPGRLMTDVHDGCAHAGIDFATVDGESGFHVDPVPRVISGPEWAELEAGLAQRLRGLNAFVADAYGERAIVEAGVVPERVLTDAEFHEPAAAALRPPGGLWIGVAGLDLVRGADGRMLVLEDNTRTPSGIGYAIGTRAQLAARLEIAPQDAPRPLDDAIGLLAATLRSAAPEAAGGEPRIAVVTDGAENSAIWEHRFLASGLGVGIHTPDDLELRGAHLYVRDGGPRIDALYRRTDDSRMDSAIGKLLREPLTAGTLGCVNVPGTGVADDKLAHAYVEDMIRFYLDEEPLLPSVRTFDLQRDDALAEALDRIDELVIKPRGGYGGVGVVIGPHAEPADVERTREDVASNPAGYVAQELVMLSTHPTVVDGRLAPRHVDLRPFAFLRADGEVRVMPGGLTRVALDAGALVVNSSQNGGNKDTWVMA